MKRTQIIVREEQHDYLTQQAAVNIASISEVIRKMIDEKMAETTAYQLSIIRLDKHKELAALAHILQGSSRIMNRLL